MKKVEKDFYEIARELMDDRVKIEVTRGAKHVMFVFIVDGEIRMKHTGCGSPSDHRSMKNWKSEVRLHAIKRGVPIKDRRE